MSCITCDPGVCICPPPRMVSAETLRQMTEWLPPEQPPVTTTGKSIVDIMQVALDGAYAPPAASEIQVGGSHYRDFAIQPAEFIHKNAIGFLAGNVIKYVCRHGKKNGVEDLKKARHYIDLLIEHEYGNT